VEQRIDLLARMGSGIAPSAIQSARDAAARAQPPTPPSDETPVSTSATESTGFEGFTRLYDQPVDGSRLLALLPDNAVVTLEDREGDFMRVTTRDGTAGYILRSALEVIERR
jgi:hypothetical protein